MIWAASAAKGTAMSTSIEKRLPSELVQAPRAGARRRPAIEDVPRDGNQPLWELPAPLPPPAERLHRKQRLAAAFRLFGRLGFEVGLAGHFSARDAIRPDLFWVNPLGMSFGDIRASDLLLVDPEGTVVEGEGMVNLSGVPYHDHIQRVRPEVVGIAHAHSFHAKVWSSFVRPLDPITADAAVFHDDQVVFNPQRPDGRSMAEGRSTVVQQAIAALGDRNVLIWQNHGLWTVGATVEAAAWRFIMFEDAARGQLAAEAAGTPFVPPTPAKTPEARKRSEVGAWLSFLPLWDRIVREEPDLLE
jgi:ribulose-5-phosphate 4-epimerase/fuculose-1-phosphate aldolase